MGFVKYSEGTVGQVMPAEDEKSARELVRKLASQPGQCPECGEQLVPTEDGSESICAKCGFSTIVPGLLKLDPHD